MIIMGMFIVNKELLGVFTLWLVYLLAGLDPIHTAGLIFEFM